LRRADTHCFQPSTLPVGHGPETLFRRGSGRPFGRSFRISRLGEGIPCIRQLGLEIGLEGRELRFRPLDVRIFGPEGFLELGEIRGL
jgi:hypothetical protein